MSQQVIYKSLQQFLFRKNMITQAILTAAREKDELWNNTLDEAYKSYATHRLGIHAPLIPTNVFQVDPRILDDADWVLLDSADSDAGLNAVPATPRQNNVQEPEDLKDDEEEEEEEENRGAESEDLPKTDEESPENTFVPGANSDEVIEDTDETDDESAS